MKNNTDQQAKLHILNSIEEDLDGNSISDDTKRNAKNTGDVLTFKLQIVDGPRKNRILWDRVNLNHSNPKATAIGIETVEKIRRATGVAAPVTSSAQFHNIPMYIKVGIEQYNGGDSNVIKGYKSAAEGGAVETATAAPGIGAAPNNPFNT